MQLFIKYQIPSDLLSFSGGACNSECVNTSCNRDSRRIVAHCCQNVVMAAQAYEATSTRNGAKPVVATMVDVLHVIEGIFNKTDYAVIGLLTVLVIAVVFTPLFKMVDSLPGRCATLGATLYYYARWQIDVARIPMKTDHPTDADKIEFFRMTRNAYLLYSGIVLALFSFTVARLRGRIDELEAKSHRD